MSSNSFSSYRFFLFSSWDFSCAFFICKINQGINHTNHFLRQHAHSLTHHDDKDSNKNRNKVGEESQRVLDVVHVPTVRPLDDLLGVKHHISQENQEAKEELQLVVGQLGCMLSYYSFRFVPITSNMKVALVWPKIEVANCSQRRMERPDESRPPRYRYSLRLAMMAAPEKHAKATAVPTNAVTRILVHEMQFHQQSRPQLIILV
jgi:hypothetical protein